MIKPIYFENQETNYEISSDGKVFNKKTKKELKGTYARNEYHSVQLTINGKPKTFMVHRLVAESFLDNPNNFLIVDHIDRNKLNNDVSNLRWVDNSTNAKNCERKVKNKIKEYFEGNIDDFWKETSEKGYFVNDKGQVLNSKTKYLLKGTERNGYIRVSLPSGYKSVHLLVWEAFNGKIPVDKVIDHIDGNRSNNSLNNLRLVCQSDNMLNSQKNGHNGQVKISQYDLKGNFIKKYSSIREAAKEINGSEYAIKEAADRNGSSAGFLWIREDQRITIEELLKITKANKPKSTAIGVTQYSLQGEKINHFNSCKEAMRNTSINESTISRAAKAQRAGKGYYWILDNQNFNIHDLI